MAQTAGVDLKTVSRQYPSFPPFPPLRHGSTYENVMNTGNIQMNDDNNKSREITPDNQPSYAVEQSVGGMAEMAETSSSNVEQVLDASALANPTFSDKLNINDLPPIIRDAAQKQATTEGRDKVILSVLNLASGFSPNVCGIYDRRLVFPPFYNFIVAPSSSQGV
jgi:hypothetical protein